MRNNQPAWIRCPTCHERTQTKIYDDTVLLNFPLWCPKCGKEIKINVVEMKLTLSKVLSI